MPPACRPFGHFQTFVNHGDRVAVAAARGTLEISPHPSGALRVRIGRKKRLPEYQSLAVVFPAETQPAASLRARPTKTGVAMRTRAAAVRLQFDPLALSFSDTKGPAFAADLFLGFRGGQIVVRKKIGPEDRLYGLGEKTGWLDRRGRKYVMRNADVWREHPAGLGSATDPLYASFPFFIVHNRRRAYGIFVDNPEFAEFDFTGDDWLEFSAPADALNYYVLPGPTLPDVVRQYTDLTGRMPLPALWTLGYHQCRWGYASEADIRRVASELRNRNIPADGIWMDIDYMDGYRVFTWDKKDFPRPKQMIADLRRGGFRPVAIVDPGVKVDDGYFLYDEGRAGDHFVKHPDGREYNGAVWPGPSAFPDFHRAATRAWWADHVRRWLADTGLSGLWNDMNEPAARDITGPILDTRHDGRPHASARNTYALQMARATFDGMLARDPDSRPFILTRAAFSGMQTVSALWGGDNSSQWEHLAASLPMLMNLGLSGMPFVGVDIGGFGGGCDGELLARWTQAGAFYPFCRNHAAAGTRSQEPWVFGPEIEAICRKYIGLRYQLLPYLYNLFREASLTGAPILRPLVWHYPKDPNTFNLNDQFMLGPDLLIAPILAPGLSARAVYLPKGKWYRWAGRGAAAAPLHGPAHVVASAPLDELPIFVRAGAIIPTWPLAQHTGAINRAGVTLHVWPGDGSLDFYEDDGASRGYERGGYRLTPIRMRSRGRRLDIEWKRPRGEYGMGRSRWTVAVHSLPGRVRAALDDRPVRCRREGDTLFCELKDGGLTETRRVLKVFRV